METTEIEHPLQQSFTRVQQLSEYIQPQLYPAGEGNWIAPLTALAADSPQLHEFAALAEKRLRTKSVSMIGGTILQSYQWPVIASAIATYLLERRVPNLALDNVQVLVSAKGEGERIAYLSGKFAALPDDPAAAHPDATIVPDQAALRDYLRAGLEDHFSWVIDQLFAHLEAGKRGLWLFVTDRCVSTLAWLMQELNQNVGYAQIEQEVNALIHAPGTPLSNKKVGLVELTYKDHSEVYLERATCCYWYKTDGGEYCTTCPLRPAEERNELLLKYMAEKYEQAS